MMHNRHLFLVISLLAWATALLGQLVQIGPSNTHECEEFEVSPNLILSSKSRVKGHLRDQTGAVMAHTRIELRSYVSGVKQTLLKQTQTGADGSFSLEVIAAGRYRFVIFAPGLRRPVSLIFPNAKECNLNVVPLVASTDTFPESVCPPK